MTAATIGFDKIDSDARRRRAFAFALPLAILAYLIYAAFSFDVAGVIDRAKPDRATTLLSDLVQHKIVVTKDNRSGEVTTAIEGERRSTYAAPPDWVRGNETTTTVDLDDGYSVTFAPDETLFAVPGFGTMRITVSRAQGVTVELPEGTERPGWLSLSKARLDARPGGRRLIVTRARQEAHRFFWGWEEFFFTVDNPLHTKSWPEIASLVFSGDRIDPVQSNAWFVAQSFIGNSNWIHGEVLKAIFETILMALLGTVFAAALALPLAFFAARNLTASKSARFGLRRVFDFLRGVDGLIWTIVLARAFGPGPMTGTLAIALTDTGTFGKLFSEAMENADEKQIEGVTATGAGPVQRNLFGVLPQVMPVFLSQILYYLESNTRSATIIGAIVGGGIGLLLVQAINTQKDWENVAYYVVLIVLMVMFMDWVSGKLRSWLIEGRQTDVM